MPDREPEVMSTYTVKAAGYFVFRTEATTAEKASEHTFEMLSAAVARTTRIDLTDRPGSTQIDPVGPGSIGAETKRPDRPRSTRNPRASRRKKPESPVTPPRLVTSVHDQKTLIDESMIAANVVHVQPRLIRKSGRTTDMTEELSDNIFALLSYVVGDDPDPVYVKVDALERELDRLRDHMTHLHAVSCDPHLHEANSNICQALQLVKNARVRLLQRSHLPSTAESDKS